MYSRALEAEDAASSNPVALVIADDAGSVDRVKLAGAAVTDR